MARKRSPRVEIAILINAKQLTTLLGQNRRIAKETASLTGELREKIAYAVDKQGLHKKAFAFLKAIDKMEPEAALEYWTHVLAYLDMAGVTKRMDSVTRMDLEGENEPAGKPVASLEKARKAREEKQLEAAE